MIGCLYNIVVKVFSYRLKDVIRSFVDEVQSAYIKGRNILYGSLVINEIFTWEKNEEARFPLQGGLWEGVRHHKLGVFRFSDGTNGFWHKVDKMDTKLSFYSKGLGLNKLNTHKWIPYHEGLRQRDPLSPFLFILSMEGLYVAIQAKSDKSLIQGIKLPHNGPTISHLFYVDDAIVAGMWHKGSIENISCILKCFEISSRLKVNFHKSRLFGIYTTATELQDMAQIFGCLKSCFLFSYLEVRVGVNMLSKNM